MYLPEATTTQWLGATPVWKDNEVRGTNFVYFTPGTEATRVELCLFDKAKGGHETDHLDFSPQKKEKVLAEDGQTVLGYKWHGFVEGDTAKAGKMYGLRVHGKGFNPNKLLMDPEAKEITGKPVSDPRREGENNGDIMPKAVVKNWRALPAGDTKWLGATPGKRQGKTGTNFTFYTAKDGVDGVELCLFDQETGKREICRFELGAKEEVKGDNGAVIGYLWNGFAEGVKEGELYGFRVHGQYKPEEGKYFNPYKVLIDPCAKAVTHELHEWDERHSHHDWYKKTGNRHAMSRRDNCDIVPKARVVDWQALQRRAKEEVKSGALYSNPDTNALEVHVKGATILHPSIPEEERGSYKALQHQDFIKWLKDMAYTSIELMPVESHGTDDRVAKLQKINHWGYMTSVPTAPHTGYAFNKARPEEEFAQSILELKKQGIETIMDVVPNHTLETGAYGPLLNLRGMDSSLYLPYDCTGCGNTRDFGHPINRRMFLEELKYWKGLGVAGFRYDLATVLGRRKGAGFDPNSEMMKALRQDPDLQDLKSSGEPWDIGLGCSQKEQVGKLSPIPVIRKGDKDIDILDHNHIAEWNPDFRDRMRMAALSTRHELKRGKIIDVLAGSSHLYKYPSQSVNKPGGGHDGPTLFDCVASPNGKQNGPNGEKNMDGNDIPDEYYWGNPDDRLRVQRFSLALLMVSQGTPMSTIGFERCHTQLGNTNLYCLSKDPNDPYNDAAWIKWSDRMDAAALDVMDFTKQANHFRMKHMALRRGTYFSGKPDTASGLTLNDRTMKDVTWLYPDGRELDTAGMENSGGFSMLLSGDPGNSPAHEKSFIRRVKREGRDDPLLVMVNPTMQDMVFTLPDVSDVKWKAALNSLDPQAINTEPLSGRQTVTLGRHSLIAFEGELQREKGTQARASTHRRAVAI